MIFHLPLQMLWSNNYNNNNNNNIKGVILMMELILSLSSMITVINILHLKVSEYVSILTFDEIVLIMNQQTYSFKTNLAIPSLNPNSIIFGGTGDSVSIRNLSIRQVSREIDSIIMQSGGSGAGGGAHTSIRRAECCRIL